jgi:transglutaminase-like putative cysteine protease
MQIRVGYEVIYQCPAATPMILTLNAHDTRASDLLRPDHLVARVASPSIPIASYRDSFGNWCSRIVAPAGRVTLSTDAIVNDTGAPDPVAADAQQRAVESLPEETLIFHLGSRYCEADLLSEVAWKLFSASPSGWGRVQAICEFVHNHVQFGYEHASPIKTACQVWNKRRGVCRDYAHLAIASCRCMNIPARYCTGYLGEIDVPRVPAPIDFAGWFEAYVGDAWYTFDARNNMPRIGRVLRARGRDAADVAISTAFGPNTLESFRVWTDEVVAS